jgi:hypothetical protein
MGAINEFITLPIPGIDHVVVNAGTDLPGAARVYARLGFTLTPEGRHTLGTVNHLAMFGPDYLELLGVSDRPATGLDVLNWPPGLAAIAFATDDADAVHAALQASGVPVEVPIDFSRPVALPDGIGEASFRVVRLAPQLTSGGRLFFCQHRTRAAVWRNEWRRHANGVLGIEQVVIAAEDPAPLGTLLSAVFGAAAMVAAPGGLRLAAGLSRIDVVRPDELARRYGPAAPPLAGRLAMMAALVLRTANLAATAAALRDGGIAGVVETQERILVPAEATLGVLLEFRPA